MKIGLVCPYNVFRGGGVQECVLALRQELSRRGHTAKILTPQSREARSQSLEGVIFLGGGTEFKSPFHTTAQVSASVNLEAMQTVLDEEKFDVLHFHEPWVPIVSRQLLARSTSANVATFHAKLPDSIMSRTIERVVTPYTKSILKYLHTLTAVSPAAAQYVKTLTKKDIAIVPNGIDLKKYRAHKPTENSQMILYIGRLERRKGVRYLLDAFKLLKAKVPGATLVIAGDGPDRPKLEAFAKDNKISGVTFLGYVEEADKLRLLSEAGLFCSPALFGESFGIVLLEAMAAGVVTVAGNNPGYSGVMQGIGSLSLVNPKVPVEFASRMELLLTDHQLRQLWQDWAQDYVAQFDYAKVVDQYEKLYKQAVKAR